MNSNPFLSAAFMNALTESGSVNAGTGWIPLTFEEQESGLYTYIKNHSYGEYIFDWGWAEAYERYGLEYYPKLTSMVPFTPATVRHFRGQAFDQEEASRLIRKHDQFFEGGPYSSAHFLYLEQDETELFVKENYLLRESLQYHFFNEGYDSFEAFLGKLKPKRAKTIRKERAISEVTIKRITGAELTEAHADQMFHFYLSTIEKKNSFDYLNRDFFRLVFRDLRNQTLYIQAEQNGRPVGGSLFFFDDRKLYGRYWGSDRYIENLHFELCYYQGIDFCIEKGLTLFEAGAQGEHKIPRGFRPVIIYSAHKIKDPQFRVAIKDFIRQETHFVRQRQKELSLLLPFRSS